MKRRRRGEEEKRRRGEGKKRRRGEEEKRRTKGEAEKRRRGEDAVASLLGGLFCEFHVNLPRVWQPPHRPFGWVVSEPESGWLVFFGVGTHLAPFDA